MICPRRDSNMGASDLWPSTLPLDYRGALRYVSGDQLSITLCAIRVSDAH